jgi:hypothetical protein
MFDMSLAAIDMRQCSLWQKLPPVSKRDIGRTFNNSIIALSCSFEIKIGRFTPSLNVRYWHKADIGLRGHNVCLGGKAGIHRT